MQPGLAAESGSGVDWQRRVARRQPARRVTIEGFDLTFAERSDNGRRVTIMLDDNSVSFIQTYFTELVRLVIRAPRDGGGSGAEDDGRSSSSVNPPVAKFQFSQSEMPNIRDKVMWHVPCRAWRATAKVGSGQGRKTVSHEVTVNTSLPPEDFRKAKLEAYWEAVEWWNTNDETTRHRIPSRPR